MTRLGVGLTGNMSYYLLKLYRFLYMFKAVSILLLIFSPILTFAQDIANSPWHIQAENIDPNEYYGVTCANGVVGLVSSPEPMQVQDVILNGVYDYYQRGRVSNILKTFNHMNVEMEVDGQTLIEVIFLDMCFGGTALFLAPKFI